MSTTQQSETATYTCDRDGCQTEVEEHALVHGSFCSQQCYDKHRGAKQLRNIKHDHRWCHGCFRQLKDIERPGDEYSVVIGPVDHDAVADTARDVLVGYQYFTEHATHGEKTGRGVDDSDTTGGHSVTPDTLVLNDGDTVDLDPISPEPEVTPAPADTLVITGTICECGTTDHRDDYLRSEQVTSVRAATKRLCRALLFTGREGQHDKQFDIRVLARTLKESLQETGEYDWELAVGRAIKPS